MAENTPDMWRTIALGTVVAAVLAVAACDNGVQAASGGVQTASGPGRPVPTPAVAAASPTVVWSNQICGALAPFLGNTRNVPRLDRNDLAGSRRRFQDYVNEQVDALGRAMAGVDEAGPAPVPNGQQLSATLNTTLTQLHGLLVRSQEQLAAVPSSDPDTLASTLQRIAGTFVGAGGQAGLADLAFPPELNQAAQQAPNCRTLQPVGVSTPVAPPPSATG